MEREKMPFGREMAVKAIGGQMIFPQFRRLCHACGISFFRDRLVACFRFTCAWEQFFRHFGVRPVVDGSWTPIHRP